ncbi:MAG: hypothetical protein KatS3mg065_0591 [Chloroflexota bacterium]|nr:MAG: hypothetical protein KatS3mg065_0591 [Chloroflexota bacterium]
MIEAILTGSGLVLVLVGLGRGYGASRSALAPLAHAGEPTRAAIEAGRPLVARSRVRRFVRGTILAVGWLLVAGYGLFLVSVGLGR